MFLLVGDVFGHFIHTGVTLMGLVGLMGLMGRMGRMEVEKGAKRTREIANLRFEKRRGTQTGRG